MQRPFTLPSLALCSVTPLTCRAETRCFHHVAASGREPVALCAAYGVEHPFDMQGLTVELRAYQRQSLKFMMDSEDMEGGFRHHLFCPVTNSKGEKYWYSPVLGRICDNPPPMSHGGILGESSISASTMAI